MSILFTKKMVKTFSQGWLRDAFCYGLSQLLLSFHLTLLICSHILGYSFLWDVIELGPSFFHSIHFAEDRLHSREIRQRVSLWKLRCWEGAGWERRYKGSRGVFSVSPTGTHFCLGPSQELISFHQKERSFRDSSSTTWGQDTKAGQRLESLHISEREAAGPPRQR